MVFPRVFRLEAYQKAFEKGSRNKNTEAQRAQRGREIQTKLRDLSASVFQGDFVEPLCRYGFPPGVSIRGLSKGF